MICPSCRHENLEGVDRCEECLTPLTKLDVPRSDATEGLARSVMEDDLSHLQPEETIAVAPSTPALDVIRKMKEANTGCVLVVDQERLVGIFTEHDVLTKLSSDWPRSVPVAELMTANPETLNERDSVATALNKMSVGRYRHLPVVKANGQLAVTSILSVLKYIGREVW
jgi:CBS domain-containing protein